MDINSLVTGIFYIAPVVAVGAVLASNVAVYRDMYALLESTRVDVTESLQDMMGARMSLQALSGLANQAGYNMQALLNREVAFEVMCLNPKASDILRVRYIMYYTRARNYNENVRRYRDARTKTYPACRLAIWVHGRQHLTPELKGAHIPASQQFVRDLFPEEVHHEQ